MVGSAVDKAGLHLPYVLSQALLLQSFPDFSRNLPHRRERTVYSSFTCMLVLWKWGKFRMVRSIVISEDTKASLVLIVDRVVVVDGVVCTEFQGCCEIKDRAVCEFHAKGKNAKFIAEDIDNWRFYKFGKWADRSKNIYYIFKVIVKAGH